MHILGRRASQPETKRPSRTEVEAAVRTIIQWTGDDPDRDGLIETPARVTRSFEGFFSGYGQDPAKILEKTFEEIEGYDEMIVLRDIRFESTTLRRSSAGPGWLISQMAAWSAFPSWPG